MTCEQSAFLFPVATEQSKCADHVSTLLHSTEFLPEHPGGSKIILKYAGKDAT